MNAPSAKLLVLVGQKFACIRIVGRANFTSSVDFKTLINELRQKGYRFFVLELSECMLMDSTFLGVLAGFGLKMTATEGAEKCGTIELLNPNPRIMDLLENLGVLDLFRVVHGPADLPEKGECVAAAPVNANREEVTRACLEAHETLMHLNPDNVARFKEVAHFLAEDLKKLKAAPTG